MVLDNWTEDGDYVSIERPIKEKLSWYEVDREESGSQVEYKDGSGEVLGFDEDNAVENQTMIFILGVERWKQLIMVIMKHMTLT